MPRLARRVALVTLAIGLALPLAGPTGIAVADTFGTMVITSDTTLTQDHDGSIVVTADGVTLDCDGHLVTSDPTDQGIWVDGRDDVTIQNCHVTNALNGVAVGGFSERTLVTDNTAFGNANAGIAADQAVETTITGNTTTENGGNGIQVIDATAVLVSDNTSSQNVDFGIGTLRAHTSVFRGNTVTQNSSDGFNVIDSDDNVVTDNVVQENGLSGIALFNSDGNVLRSNTVRGNGLDTGSDGFHLEGSSRNVLRGNLSSGNGNDGFGLTIGSNANVVARNEARRNVVTGISVCCSHDNTIAMNTAVANFRAVYLVTADGSVVRRNVAIRSEGIAFEGHEASGMTWRGNSVIGVPTIERGDGGFLIRIVTRSRFVGNVARDTGGYGFRIFGRSDDNVFVDNRASQNVGHGFLMQRSRGNLLKSNEAMRNGVGGFYVLLGSSHNTLRENTACRNAELDAFDDGTGRGNVWRANEFCTSDIT